MPEQHLTDPLARLALVSARTAELERQIQALQSELEIQRNHVQVLAALVRDTPAALVLVDNRLTIQTANLEAQDLLGIPPDAEKMPLLTRCIHPNDHAALQFLCDRALRGADIADVELRCVEGRRTLLARASLLAGDTLVLALVDITSHIVGEHKRRQDDHRNYQARTLKALGQLSGSIAHDVNNILTAITALTACALADLDPDSSAREDVLQIQEAAIRGRAMTTDLRLISKHNTVTDLQPIDKQIHQMARMLERIKPSHVEITYYLDAPDAQISGEQDALLQMLAAVLTTAVDSAQENVTVESHIERDDDQDWVIITVIDDGIEDDEPIDPTRDPFQASRSVGLELGLAHALAIAQRCGGLLILDPDPAQGTAVRIELPVAADPNRFNDAPDTLGGFSILVVDDHPLINKATCQVLSKTGYRTMAAHSGQESIDLMRVHHDRVRLAIIDMLMPEMDGIDTITQLRQLYPELPIVLCADHLGDRAKEVRALGVPTLTKPWLQDELLSAVRACLLPSLVSETVAQPQKA